MTCAGTRLCYACRCCWWHNVGFFISSLLLAPAASFWSLSISHHLLYHMNPPLCPSLRYRSFFSSSSLFFVLARSVSSSLLLPYPIGAKEEPISSPQRAFLPNINNLHYFDFLHPTASTTNHQHRIKYAVLRLSTSTMAGGKGKSSGGKSSGGKVGADGSKKQQSHSSKAGLQVSIAHLNTLLL